MGPILAGVGGGYLAFIGANAAGQTIDDDTMRAAVGALGGVIAAYAIGGTATKALALGALGGVAAAFAPRLLK